MRDFGKVASSIWRSKKFRGLRDNDEARLLYLYFLTCQHGNSIGCFSFSIGYAMADLGWSEDKVDRAIKDLSIALLIDWNEDEEVLRIVNFMTKSPCTNEKHAKGAAALAMSLPDCEQKYNIINDLNQDKFASKVDEIRDFDRSTIGLSKVSRTETETLTETETETLTEVNPISEIQEAVDAWNILATEFDLSKCQKITDTRRSKLKARLKDVGGLSGWECALEKVRGSPFLLGENDRAWTADIDFMLQEKSFTKLMEGGYDRNTSKQSNGRSTKDIDRALCEAAIELDPGIGQASGGLHPGDSAAGLGRG